MEQFEAILNKDHTKELYVSSFEGKYTIIDNLDKADNRVYHKDSFYNFDYVYLTVVLNGTLNIKVGNTMLEVGANQYVTIMPCNQIEIMDSSCTFFSLFTRGYLINDIYEHSTIGRKVTLRAFTYYHRSLSQQAVEILTNDYQLNKREHLHQIPYGKELSLRALSAAVIAHIYSFNADSKDLNIVKKSRQAVFFNEFMKMLGENQKLERSVQVYAKQLHITPKYLSTITQAYTGMSASTVIDNYVIYAIKQSLYDNSSNIKTISTDYHFPSQSFFGRYFKRITGLSPNEYIKLHNKKSLNLDFFK